MKSRSLMFQISLLLLCFLAAPCIATDTWHKLESSGVVIEYQDGLEQIAQQLMPEAVKLANKSSLVSVNDFASKKNDVIEFIAKKIGLDKPDDVSGKVFDGVYKLVVGIPSVKHLMLWHEKALKEAIAAGTGPQCITYDSGSGMFELHYEIGVDLGAKGNRTAFAAPPIPIPINLNSSDKPLDKALKRINIAAQVVNRVNPFHTLFHEITEGMLVFSSPLNGCCFRRWFCEGVAEYISGQCLGKFVGPSAMIDYLAEQDLRIIEFAPLRDQVDLLAWRAAEWENETPYSMDGNLSNAHYTFAAYEIRELAKRCGEDAIAKVCKEMRESKVGGGREIIDAISKATGDNMSERLLLYGTKSPDKLKGLAFNKFSAIVRTGGNENQIVDDAEIQVDKDSVIIAEAFATSLDFPLNIEMRIDGPFSAKCEVTQKEKPKFAPDLGITPPVKLSLQGSFSSTKFKPGDYTLSIYLQSKMVKQVKFKLVEGVKT